MLLVSHARAPRPQVREPIHAADGSVLMWALMFTVITSAMIISHSGMLAANRREMHVRFEHQTLADNFARAGLTDALVWFQKQPTQPVAAFAPRFTPNADPPLLETLDPTVGLVREFEVRGNLWARYEVRTGEAFDISAERGIDQAGSVWDVGARAYLYEKQDPSQAFDQGPNRVIATDYLRSEMRGIPILPPAAAALNIDDPTRLDVGPQGLISGGCNPAVAYPAPPPAPPPLLPLPLPLALPLPLPILSALITGTPAALPLATYDAAAMQVFWMRLDQIRSLADFVFEAGPSGAAGTRALGTGGDGGALAVGVQGTQTPDSLLSWWTRVVSSVTGVTSTTTSSTLPGLSTTFSAVGNNLTNALGWLNAGRAKFAAGSGQPQLATSMRALRSRAIFVKGDLVLDATTPLAGRVLLIVDGDLTIQDGNVSDLQGLIYVTGDVVIDGDFHLQGTLIGRGGVAIGHGTQPVRIQFSQTALDMLKKDLERYRLSRSLRPGWSR